MDDELVAELLTRRDEDQRVRRQVSGFVGQPEARVPDELPAKWERVDSANTAWLGELLATRGWPGRTLVGDDGAQAAWLLAQHADREPGLQQAFLDALREAVGSGEASPAHLAVWCGVAGGGRADRRAGGRPGRRFGAQARPGARGVDGRLLLAAAFAGVIDVIANICYVAATGTGMFGLAVVMASLYPGVTVLLARVVLGERLRWLQRAGLAIAALGILLIAV